MTSLSYFFGSDCSLWWRTLINSQANRGRKPNWCFWRSSTSGRPSDRPSLKSRWTHHHSHQHHATEVVRSATCSEHAKVFVTTEWLTCILLLVSFKHGNLLLLFFVLFQCYSANHGASLPWDSLDCHQQAWSQSHWPKDKGSCGFALLMYETGETQSAAYCVKCEFAWECELIVRPWNNINRTLGVSNRIYWLHTASLRSPTGAVGTPTFTSPSGTWSEEANFCVKPHW